MPSDASRRPRARPAACAPKLSCAAAGVPRRIRPYGAGTDPTGQSTGASVRPTVARSAARPVDLELAHRDELVLAAGRAVEANPITGDGREVEDVALVVGAIVSEREGRREMQIAHVCPHAGLTDLDRERVEPAAVPEVHAFLEHHAAEGLRRRERIPDPILRRGVRAIVGVVLATRVRRSDR